MKTNTQLTSALGALALLISAGWNAPRAQAQTASYNFDAGQSDFQNTFNFTTSISGFNDDSWYYNTGLGIGGTNTVQGPGAVDCTAVYKPLGFANTSGTTVTASTFFLAGTPYSQQSGQDQGDFAGVALIGSTTGSIGIYRTTASGYLATYVERITTSAAAGTTGTDVSTLLEGASSNSNGTNEGGFNGIGQALVPGHWYKVTATYQFQGSSILSTEQLADYGTTGTASPTTIGTASGTVTDPFTGSDVYVALYGGTDGGNQAGAKEVDNFAVTGAGGTATAPEPTALALILSLSMPCLLALSFAARRSGGKRITSLPDAMSLSLSKRF